MLVQELCDLGVLSWAIHKKRLFVPMAADPHKLALRALLRTAREVAVGLHHLHEAGVVHGGERRRVVDRVSGGWLS
jgi:hypothetical protein